MIRLQTQQKLAILMGLVNLSFLGKTSFRAVTAVSLVSLIVFNLSMADIVSGTKSKRSYLIGAIVIPMSLVAILLS